MKKAKAILFLTSFLSLSVMSFVSAQLLNDRVFGQIKTAADPILRFFLGETPTGELLFVKFLVFLIVLALVNLALKRFPGFGDNDRIVVAISLIVALLSVRYLTTDQLVNFIWLPYGGLGILLSSLLPFIIFFFFIESFDVDLIRKVGWVAFMSIYFVLGYLRFDDFNLGTEWWQNLAWIYVIVGIISLMIIIFEKYIRYKMQMSMIEHGISPDSIIQKNELIRKLQKIEDALANSDLGGRDRNKLFQEKKKIKKIISRLGG